MSTKIFLKLKLNLGRLGIALCQPLCHHYAYGKNICVSEQKMPMWVWVAVNGVHKSRWGENGACSSIMYPITWWSWIGRIHHPPYIRRITHPSFTQKQIGQVNHQGNGATHFLDFFLKGQVLSFMFPEGEPPIPPWFVTDYLRRSKTVCILPTTVASTTTVCILHQFWFSGCIVTRTPKRHGVIVQMTLAIWSTTTLVIDVANNGSQTPHGRSPASNYALPRW